MIRALGWECLICSSQRIWSVVGRLKISESQGEICEAAFAKHGDFAELDSALSNKLC